jgi:hypothetical protein
MTRSTISSAATILLAWLYRDALPPEPQNYKVRTLAERNQEIRQRLANGEDTSSLADEYGILLKRDCQILQRRCK